MWYTLNLGTIRHYFEINDTINEKAWNNLNDGVVIIRFYVNHINGHLEFAEVMVIKNTGVNNLIPGYDLLLLCSILCIAFILFRKRSIRIQN